MTFQFKRATHTLYAITNTVVISKVDPSNATLYSVTLPLSIYTRWRNGEALATLTPELTAEQRNFLLTEQTPGELAANLPSPYDDTALT